MEKADALIYALFVDNNHRKCGVAKHLLKHKPFGWVKTDDWYCAIKEIRPTCAFCHGCGDVFHYTDMVKQINFADGTPFGVKVK